MVHLQKWQDMYEKSGLFVFTIAMHEDLELARRISREKGFRYPIFNGVGSAVGEKYAYG